MNIKSAHSAQTTLLGFAAAFLILAAEPLSAEEIQFIVTSDVHFGITRADFQGGKDVNAEAVNKVMVGKMNALPALTLPTDYGVKSGEEIGPIDFVAVTGDIANRMEVNDGTAIQSAAASWAQFKTVFVDGLTLKDEAGNKSQLFVVPGNHDVSNAIGFYKKMEPATDATSMVEIYNMEVKPATPITTSTYNYATDRIHYSRDVGGIHFVFLNVWPDAVEQAWLETDLKNVPATTPVVLFTHDGPVLEAKHLTNPNGAGDINATDKFENLLVKASETTVKEPTLTEQQTFVDFVKKYPNIAAYFHGNTNLSQYYDYAGPDNSLGLHVVRVDSPMKGEVSAKDETKLSFQLVTLDTANRLMTVREALWNADKSASSPVVFGASVTFALAPRPVD
ncbi:metallophosphoesterase family protein [Mesorhizobium comanense]|uniref:metallophosphoesterase family protein n=1 Tax=Mesorhizobium comanense TaxID=2502215 RepID=UPI001485C2DE|nr:metallophosphoesterase [Mesorhizobium comanense]